MVNPEDAQNTISRQCELLGISRNAYYYEPKFSDFKLRVMTCIDELYTKDPTSGQRKLQANLKKYYGIDVGRRLIRHLMEIMQIAAIYPKPNRWRQSA